MSEAKQNSQLGYRSCNDQVLSLIVLVLFLVVLEKQSTKRALREDLKRLPARFEEYSDFQLNERKVKAFTFPSESRKKVLLTTYTGRVRKRSFTAFAPYIQASFAVDTHL